MEEVDIKETQGQKKVQQYVDDLLRNKHFMVIVKKLLAAYNRNKISQQDSDELNKIIDEYKKLDAKAKKYERENFDKLNWLQNRLVEEYGLDTELLMPVLIANSSLKEGDFKDSQLYHLATDLCSVTDNYDENLNTVFPPIPITFDNRKQNHWKAFPISIDIHRFATKRDVLDYIEKRWVLIENMLSVYKEKRVKFRKRKYNRKLLDFIWDNKGFGIATLKKLLDEKFPHNGLIYYELYKIISLEKQRRNLKIIVGQ